MLTNLSIEGHYVWSKNTVVWNAFAEISMIHVFWDFVPHGSKGRHPSVLPPYMQSIQFNEGTFTAKKYAIMVL
jgi:hypothetical protein